MTNERAIELLHRISDSQFDGPHGDERREALEMAVRALEGDGDTISRQQAIDAVVSAMIDGADAELVEGVMELLPSAQPETPCYLGSPCEYQNKDIKLPSAQPETHDKRTETHACDLIGRQDAIDQLHQSYNLLDAEQRLEDLPSAQPEIIRCKDCKNWDTTWINDFSPNYHYCPMVDGVRKEDWYCADAERRTDVDVIT